MRPVSLPTLLAALWTLCEVVSGFYVVPGTSIASSTAAIVDLLKHQEEMVEVLLRHILTPVAKGDQRVVQLHNMLNKVQRHLQYMPGDVTDDEFEEFIAHPLNAYQLIKGWAGVGDILVDPQYSHNVAMARDALIKEKFFFPTSLDNNAVINQILHLQSVYRLNVTQMAGGTIHGKRACTPMDEMDFYLFGRAAFFYRHYHYAVDWLKIASEEDNAKRYQTHIGKEVHYTLYKVFRADKQWKNAERSLEAAAELDHRDKDMWDELARFKQQLFIDKPKKKPLELYDRPTTYHEGLFKRLCRTQELYLPPLKHELKVNADEDENESDDKLKDDKNDDDEDLTKDIKKKGKKKTDKGKKSKKAWKKPRGFCRYRSGQGAYVVYQEEVLSKSPLVSIFHHVFPSNQSLHLTEIATPKLTSHTIDHMAGDAALVHSTKRTWLVDDKDTELSNITARLDDVFYDKCRKPSQSLDDALEKHKRVTWYQCRDPLQVYNYGVGGFASPYVDGVSDTSETLIDGGHKQIRRRAASTLIFLSDVEAGGDIVFSSLRLRIKPEQGSVLFWETLNDDGGPQKVTKQGECPVLIGHKWVARRAIHYMTVKKHEMKYETCSPKEAPKKDPKDKDRKMKSKTS